MQFPLQQAPHTVSVSGRLAHAGLSRVTAGGMADDYDDCSSFRCRYVTNATGSPKISIAPAQLAFPGAPDILSSVSSVAFSSPGKAAAMADVFISHVEEDETDSLELAAMLEDNGYRVWYYERDSLPGLTYISQIVRAIDTIKAVVVLISERALKSEQVDREVVRAFHHNKPILPVLKGLSFQQFQRLKPDWDHILGASGAIALPEGGVRAIGPRIMAGLAALDLRRGEDHESLEAVELRAQSQVGRTKVTAETKASRQGVLRTLPLSAGPLRLSDLATSLDIPATELMRKVREILNLEVRTPSFLLTSSQVERLQTALFGPPGSASIASAAGQSDSSNVPLRLDLGADVVLELLWVPAGTFSMGSPPCDEGHNDDEVEHRVIIGKPIYLGQHLVSQEQFEQMAGFNPCYFKSSKLPVEMVSWYDSVSFCEQLSEKFGRRFRLPTEAEWEYACRAGTTTAFSTGATITTQQANFDGWFTYGQIPQGLSRRETTPIGSFPPNPWGFFDMHGNVWEWCSDWYGQYESGPVLDPEGPAEGEIRILRGGSWFHSPADCRSAQRDALDPGRRHSIYGFRVAADA